jgi:thiamine kinase-like enzyme
MAHEHDLPEAVIHGDAWAGNLVQSAPDKVTLIDWELAGLGLAILDLGRLLLFCHEDVDPPSTVWIEPEAWRVEAVVDGYCQQRIPLLRERDMLLEAVRYPIVIEAASEFPRARQHGWDEESQERLRIRRHWYDVSEEIARHGRERINQRRSS